MRGKNMKVICCVLICLILLTSLTGCVHETYGYYFHFYTNEKQGKIVVEPNFNPTIYLCKDVDMCDLDCNNDSHLVCLRGGKRGSRELTFIAIPNEGYQVKEWILNGEVVQGNKSNVITVTVSYKDDYNGVISVRFELVE